jgi:hypothetical protein
VSRGDLQTTFVFKGFDEVRRLGLRQETEAVVRSARARSHGAPGQQQQQQKRLLGTQQHFPALSCDVFLLSVGRVASCTAELLLCGFHTTLQLSTSQQRTSRWVSGSLFRRCYAPCQHLVIGLSIAGVVKALVFCFAPLPSRRLCCCRGHQQRPAHCGAAGSGGDCAWQPSRWGLGAG